MARRYVRYAVLNFQEANWSFIDFVAAGLYSVKPLIALKEGGLFAIGINLGYNRPQIFLAHYIIVDLSMIRRNAGLLRKRFIRTISIEEKISF